MQLFGKPRTLQTELQVLFLAVGTTFLALATVLLYQNGQASLRRQLIGTATTASETAAALVNVDEHRSIRRASDMNSPGFRAIVEDLSALRRANPAIYHLFTLAPTGGLGQWGVVVDMGGAAPIVNEEALQGGRLPIGSPPPENVPASLLHDGMESPTCRILELDRVDRARVVAISPIRGKQGESVGLAVVEMSAAGLLAEARLLGYVSIAIFLLGLFASIIASAVVSRWVTRPLQELLRGVEAISKGELGARVETKTRNEIGALGDAINQMAAGLEASQQRDAAQQARLRDLHRIGSEAAATLELPATLEVAARGMAEICGGTESIAGAAARREGRIRLWSRVGRDAVDDASWDASPESIEAVLGAETRLLARVEFETAGLGFLLTQPSSYAIAAPLRVNDQTIGILLVLGEQESFHADAVSLARLFAAQVSAAVANARLFEQVRELDRSKSEFLSIASHEVRTPLTVMKSSLDLLVGSKQFEYTEDQRQLIAFCQESVERLIRLVKDILDISKIEAGVLKVSLMPTSINELVEKCLFWVPQLPGGQGIEIDARLPSRPLMAAADGGRIQQVLENLMSNAIKFSNPGGRVTIELVEHEHEIEVIVSDQGKGIAAEDLHRIFGKFYQVEEAATRERGGTGLGLAICKGIIEAHRGRLWAESKLGHGSRFHFTIARALESEGGVGKDTEMPVAPILSPLRNAPSAGNRKKIPA
ncbi:MAG TPA: ATP-binding protein [Candidatus Eisenbacteria bacterium]|nr:ATP-binding protein [Candidatus Eisenbacteria bacterium]